MDVLDRYRAHLRAQGFVASTVRARMETVQRCCHVAGCKPEELDTDDVELFLGRDLAPATRRSYLWALREYARWAGLPDITSTVRRPREPRGTPRPVSEDDLATLLKATRGTRTRTWLMLGAYAGLRAFESAKLAGRDLEGTPTGQGLRVVGKGGRVDVVPVPGVLMRELVPLLDEHGARRFWPDARSQTVQDAVRKASSDAGLSVTSHQLRHRYGTQLYAHSRDLLVVQRLMRHSSPRTTAGYALVLDDVGAGLVDRLP